jgi:hypothetical protein
VPGAGVTPGGSAWYKLAMHRAKLSTFVIDCKTDDLTQAAAFWSKALRRPLAPPQPGDDRYRDLVGAPAEPIVMIQRVSHESRIHLDIESEDIEAEVKRLEGLGARALERIHTWVVMESPTGQRFCVVRVQRPQHVPPPYEPRAEHAFLASLAGHYAGTTHTFFEPDAPATQSEDTLYVEPILGGRFVRLQWFGSLSEKPRQGELLLGYHVDAGEHELTWVDTFHTGSAMQSFRGKPDGDSVQVRGSYLAGDQRWGWTFRFTKQGDVLQMRCLNVSPQGEEYRAIETDFRVAYPGALANG